MRAIDGSKACVVLAGFVILLFDAGLIQSEVLEQTISGSLISENGGLSCDRCLISLLANGIRPVATAFLDLGGHFTFRGVPRGSYTIHAEIDGFEDVNQPVEAHEGLEPNITINLVRKARRARGGDGDIVNVSEFLDAYPKKAVDAFKKGIEYHKLKKNEDAMKSFETAVRIAPGFYQAHNELGILY